MQHLCIRQKEKRKIVSPAPCTLYRCLDIAYKEKVYLEGDSAYNCEVCKQKTNESEDKNLPSSILHG